MTHIDIRELHGLPADELAPVLAASAAEGHTFVGRLVAEHASGANRFDRPGEALYGAACGRALVGIGGLNRDPYGADTRIGRLRHLYVLPAFRGRGVGRQLVAALVARARRSFDAVTLRTLSPDAAAFYQALGFADAVDIPHATHILRLKVSEE